MKEKIKAIIGIKTAIEIAGGSVYYEWLLTGSSSKIKLNTENKGITGEIVVRLFGSGEEEQPLFKNDNIREYRVVNYCNNLEKLDIEELTEMAESVKEYASNTKSNKFWYVDRGEGLLCF